MPQINQSYLQAYSFREWRERMAFTKGQAAVMLGISESTYWRMEKLGIGGRLHAWACYGLEQCARIERERAAPSVPDVQPKK